MVLNTKYCPTCPNFLCWIEGQLEPHVRNYSFCDRCMDGSMKRMLIDEDDEDEEED